MTIIPSSGLNAYQTQTLANGLRIIHRTTTAPVMYCGFMIDCGTRHEANPGQYGMAHFVEHILFKGTTTRDAWHINNRMESVGGELNAFTTKENTTFYAIGLNKDFLRACELLCDLICHPIAPQHDLEKEREVVIDEIMSYRDTPSELIYDEFENELFANHPLGHNILGNEQTVRSFDHEQCMRFISEHYTTERMIFFHQGSTPFDKVVCAVSKYFDAAAIETRHQAICQSSIEKESLSVPTETDEPAAPRFQSHVLLGTRSFPIGHPDSAALALLNNILGGPGMNSRLGLQLREHRGLVYTVESNISSFTDNGYFGIYFGCDHSDVNHCLRLCHKELDRFCQQTLTSSQLSRAQKQFCGQLGVSMANLENNAIALAKNQLRLGRVDSLEQTCQRIYQVTPEQIKRVACELFAPERLQTVIIK